jgi:hypothetical protein
MIRSAKILFLIILLLFIELNCFPFQQTSINGVVKDSTGSAIEKVNVTISGTSTGTLTDRLGNFSVTVPEDEKEYTAVFSFVGFRTEKRTVKCDREEIFLNVVLFQEFSRISEVTISSDRRNTVTTLILIPLKDINLLPSASGSFEAILKTMPGIASNNEMSSLYSVRGGNYDENLVYVNDIEIFRPFLIRSGQQEGLSFINPDLTSSVRFSPGGFSASYGDKMSSVLDITYKKPVSDKGSVSLGLLTSSVHHEGISKNHKITWLIGARYKSSRMMLKTLDSKGDYQPVFADIQSIITYKSGNNSMLSFLGTYSSNTYNFIPQSRVSNFGNEVMAYQLYLLFNGGEKDKYETWNTVLNWEFKDKSEISHKILVSSFGTYEKEAFDIRGSYSLNSLDKNAGSENFTDSLMNIGAGSWLSHARNKLSADIKSLAYRGEKELGKSILNWGLKIRNDRFNDKIKEWTMTDSAGYALPYNSSDLKMTSLIMSANRLSNWLLDSYFQSASTIIPGSREVMINAGVRGLYNSFSNEFLISPRLSTSINAWKNIVFRLSGGLYFQPAFYREMRYSDGRLNRQIKSQKSFHTVLGMTYDFRAWNRPFRLSTELYNKALSNIILYRLDNVRLIYSGENSTKGYSRGIDVRLNGEFVPDAESWISLSLMDSKLEKPSTDMGKFPSPSDQTFSMNIFFQDYLPGYPTIRAHINISFATGIPIISPYNERYDQYHRLPPYRRVDLGMTKVIKSSYSDLPGNNLFSCFDEIVAGIEVFNLLDINNTISYLWIRTVNNLSGQMRQFAVPDYLTGRSLNFRISATF